MAQPSDNAASSKLLPLRFALVAALIVILSAPAYYLLEYWPHRAGSYPSVALGGSSRRVAKSNCQRAGATRRDRKPRFFVSTLVCLTSIEDCRQEDINCQRTSLRQNCLAFLSSGKVEQHAIRLPEGANMRTVMGLLENEDRFEPSICRPRGFSGRIGTAIAVCRRCFLP